MDKAEMMYGKSLPKQIAERLEWEYHMIDEKNMGELFLEAMKTVAFFKKEGYAPFVRGCGGSSLVAWFLGITDVNPLPAHYICPNCKEVMFAEQDICGIDLQEQLCENCGCRMEKNGFGLPPEFFFGIRGSKHRDFDLFFGSQEIILLQIMQKRTGLDFIDISFDNPEILQNMADRQKTFIAEAMLKKYKGSTEDYSFEMLLRISGLQHGAGTWGNNGKLLMQEGHTLGELICFREDVMEYLLQYGFGREESFLIADRIRRGIGLDASNEQQMRDAGIPQWYISSCNKIEYLFPKAHEIQNIRNAYRLAYYSCNYPKEYAEIAERKLV